ncbi:MAG: response regulator transcription factor [Actinobacteria bacterium]|nr:MAG: response regulator transcription factor [Actinomycetota bacterium]
MPGIKILIVDDHPVTREGLHSALDLEEGVQVIGEAASGEEAVTSAGDLRPDVVFMDVRMPGMGGIEATRAIKQVSPDSKVILFTVDESRASISEAIQAGVSGYLLKDASAEELVNAARRPSSTPSSPGPSSRRSSSPTSARTSRGSPTGRRRSSRRWPTGPPRRRSPTTSGSHPTR